MKTIEVKDLKNNIKKILAEKDISINKLSEMIGLTYSNTHSLVNRDSLASTSTQTSAKVAKALNVSIEELFKEE